MTTKQFHLGLVATFDDATNAWAFAIDTINGDDSGFGEMPWGEVFNVDTGEWEHAHMDRSDATAEELVNFQRLVVAEGIAHRLLNGLPERNALTDALGMRIG